MSVLVADVERPREGSADRKEVEVAVGVLIKPNGDFLLTSRPGGKVYEGKWELHEEIGIIIAAVHPWSTELVEYPHALVRLNFFKVFE